MSVLPRRAALLVSLISAVVMLGGCGDFYTNTHEPYSYRAETPVDVQAAPSDPVARGRACEYYLLYVFNWGNRGYAATIKNAVKDREHFMLYDPKFDETVQSWFLGFYTRECTVVTGRVGKI